MSPLDLTANELEKLPNEVGRVLDRFYAGGKKRLARVVCFDKENVSKVSAWEHVKNLVKEAERNPWKQHHTNCYWVWVIAE